MWLLMDHCGAPVEIVVSTNQQMLVKHGNRYLASVSIRVSMKSTWTRETQIYFTQLHTNVKGRCSRMSAEDESALYKSTDSGATWTKIMKGLPAGDVGRIGMTVSPVNPDVLFAVVEANEGAGVYKSADRGASWEKQSSYSTSGNYYQKIFCDPINVDKVFVINAYMVVSIDGGKNF